jgi:molybdopterin/thiamine biosynthesis adenylyltransferase
MTDLLETARPRRSRGGSVAAVGRPGAKSVVVVGAGNIGSFLLGHLARQPAIRRLTIIDRDTYEAKNLWGQDIGLREVGRPKASLQARRVRRINPALEVGALVDAVENVPLGCLRADVILACLDSRQARRYVNQAAWRLGVPWIDAGVDPDGLLARVNVYWPGPDAPDLECGWSQADYDALEQAYPCDQEATSPAPTNAPSSLGALAAALQAIECDKLLGGRAEEALIARQVVLDARWQRHFVTALRRDPHCRFDHRTFDIEQLDFAPSELSLGRVLALAPVVRTPHGEMTIRVEGHTFVTEVRCPRCGDSRQTFFRLSGRLRRSEEFCATCRRGRIPSGRDSVEHLTSLLPKSQLVRSLHSFGFRRGDVFTLAAGEAESHFQIGGP